MANGNGSQITLFVLGDTDAAASVEEGSFGRGCFALEDIVEVFGVNAGEAIILQEDKLEGPVVHPIESTSGAIVSSACL